jgi:heme exporter protein A
MERIIGFGHRRLLDLYQRDGPGQCYRSGVFRSSAGTWCEGRETPQRAGILRALNAGPAGGKPRAQWSSKDLDGSKRNNDRSSAHAAGMRRKADAVPAVMLEAEDLECTRGDRILFRGVAFGLEAGSLLRIAGANGSGKTSLLRIVCGLAVPTQGMVRWQGESVRSLREEYWKNVAYVAHTNAVKDDLTAEENLRIGCALAGLAPTPDKVMDALEQFGVAHCALLLTRSLSQGQRRRVALARLAMSAGVPVWVLDEPFTALDARAVLFLQELIAAHLVRGGIVVLTTHQEVSIAAAVALRIDLEG